MKKWIVVVIFLLQSKFNYAQPYSPFVVDTAVWIIGADDPTTLYYDSYFGFYMNGDTMYNGNNYKKVFRIIFNPDTSQGFPMWALPFQLDTMFFYGMIREDAKQIFTVNDFVGSTCPSGVEYLLYDYNYNVSDTIDLCIDVEMHDIIDSIVPIGLYNKRTFYTNNYHQYIEGVGSEAGLFQTVGTTVSPGAIPLLYQYCQSNIFDCNIVTKVEELIGTKKERVTFAPNPTTGIVNFHFDEPFVNTEIRLYDLFGNEVYYQSNSANDFTTLLNFTSGIYLLKFLFGDNIVENKKIVITN